MIFLILKTQSQENTPNELRYYIHYDDIYSVRISDILDYKDFLDDLTFEKSSEDLVMNDPFAISEFENESTWENEKGVFILKKPGFKIKKVYDSGDYQNYNAYLIKTKQTNNLLIISKITKEKNSQKIILENRLVQFVDPTFICNEILMDEDHIYSSCISLRDNNIQLCKKNYLLNTLSSCRIFNLDFDLKPDFLKNSELGLEIFTNTDGIKLYFIYFKKSLIIDIQDKFILITEESYMILKIPIKEFIIEKIRVLSYRKEREIISCLISNFKGQYMELYSLKIQSGLIDKKYLAEGLIKDNLISYDLFDKILIFYEEDPEANQIIVTELNMETLTDRVIKIDNQQQVLRTDLGHNVAVLQSRNDNFLKSVFFIDNLTERIFESRIKTNDNDIWSIISVYNKNLFLIFDYKQMNFKVYNIVSVRSIEITNPKKLDSAIITFSVKNKPVLILNLHYIEFDKIWAPHKEKFFIVHGKKNTVKITGLMNNMEITTENDNVIDYFNELKIFYPKEDDNCDSVKTFFEDDLFVFFCLDNRILLYSLVELDNNSLKLIKNKYFETNKRNFDKIRSIRFYNNHLLLTLDDDYKLSGVSIDKNDLTENNKLIFSKIRLKKDYDECGWNAQGLICSTETDIYHLTIDYQKGFLTTSIIDTVKKELIQGNKKKNFFNSYYNMDSDFILLYDSFFDEYIFQARDKNKVSEQYKTFLYPITDETQFYYITFETYLVITQRKEKLELFLIHSLSRLKLPVEEFIKNYEKMLLINTYPIENLFVIFYRTKENTIRALLFKATLEANNRLIREFLVDDKPCKKPTASSRTYGSESFLISYICSDIGNNVFKVFRYNTNGPLLIINRGQVSDVLTYKNEVNKGNEVKTKVVFTIPRKSSEFKVITTNIVIGKNKKRIMIYNLEKENVIIEGHHLHTTVLKLPKGVTFFSRANKISELDLEESLVYKRPYTNIETGTFDDKLMVLFGNYIYLNKKKEYNNNYIDCKRVFPASVGEKDLNYFQKIFICRKRDNYVYYLTNFDDLNFKLDPEFVEKNMNIFNPFFIKRKNFVYLVFAHSDNYRTLKIVKIYWKNSNDILLIYCNDIYSDSYHRKYVGFDAYYPFYDEITNSILITLHPRYTSEVMILNYSLKENKVDAKNVSYTNLYDGQRLLFYNTYFFNDYGIFGMFVVTNYYIYEVEIVNDYGWQLRILNKFYNNYGNSGKEIITFNRKYLVVAFNLYESKVNIVVWERGEENKSEKIYTTIGLNDLETFDYKITNVKFENQSDNVNIIFCTDRNPFYEEYKELKLITVRISPQKLKLDLEKMSYKDDLKLKYSSFNGKKVVVNISITLRQNFKVILFGVAFCVLFALLCLLCGLIYIVKVKNKELKNELDSMEVDMMSERGIDLGNDNESENVIRED